MFSSTANFGLSPTKGFVLSTLQDVGIPATDTKCRFLCSAIIPQSLQLFVSTCSLLSIIPVLAISRSRPPAKSSEKSIFQVFCCVFQALTAAIFAARLSVQLAQTSSNQIDWLSAAVRASACVNAILNVGDIVLSRSSTRRGVYHACSGVLWSWLSVFEEYSALRVDTWLPWNFIIAFLLDLFYSPSSELSSDAGDSLLEKVSFAWIDRVVRFKGVLQLEDLPQIDFLQGIEEYCQRFIRTSALSPRGEWHAFSSFLFREHKGKLAAALLLRTVGDLSSLALPWLLRNILANRSMTSVVSLFCTVVLGSLCGNRSSYYMRQIGMYYKSMLSIALHSKALRKGDVAVDGLGDVSTLGEVDVEAMFRNSIRLLDVWAFPMQIFLSLAGLLALLSWDGVLPALVVMFLMTPTLGFIAARIGVWTHKSMKTKDERTKPTRDILQSIVSIKMHSWEDAFVHILSDLRRVELQTIQGQATVSATMVCLMQSAPSLLTLASFLVLVWRGHTLDSQLIFTSIMFFTMLNNALVQLSNLLSSMQAMSASFSRIRTYLAAPENNLNSLAQGRGSQTMADAGFSFENVKIGWREDKPLVQIGTMAFQARSLSIVMGPTGCGKTMVLIALLRFFESLQDESPGARVAYCHQSPFLMSGSIRDNILFGRPFNEEAYLKVITACCLDLDLEQLPLGDMTTMAGSAALSGGQRARIALARAAYAQADVYILDDPLAAVDAKVQQAIIENVFGPKGILSHSTRIISTNSSPLVRIADSVHDLGSRPVKSRQVRAVEAPMPSPSPVELVKNGAVISTHSISETLVNEVNGRPSGKVEESETKTIRKRSGGLLHHPILRYIREAKAVGWIGTLTCLWLARLISVYGVYTLKLMAERTSRSEMLKDLMFFALASIGQALFFFLFVVVIYRYCIVPVGNKIHTRLVTALAGYPRSFFETVATGDLLNLLTNDLGRVDLSLSSSMITLVAMYTNLVISCGILMVSTPSSASFVLPLMLLYAILQAWYIGRLRELRHLDAASRAPLLTYLQEAEAGHLVFNVHQLAQARMRSFCTMLEENLRAVFPLVCVEPWLSLRLDILSATLQALAAGSMIAAKLDESTVGFTLTYVFQVTAILGQLARSGALFEADSISLVRLYEHAGSEQTNSRKDDQGIESLAELGSAPPTLLSTPLPPGWPAEGRVEFQSVSARYQTNLPPSLTSVSVTIAPGEKVAVIGRTGSGKSSFILSLLGMMERTNGNILIDDIDTALVDGAELRQSVALIPQHPVIFTGTVRQNVDPRAMYTDREIIAALQKSGAWRPLLALAHRRDKFCAALELLLDLRVEPGSTFSTGETQLLAITRAILQQSKILILDEATSALDSQAERQVHNTLFKEFSDTTIIAVMHKLSTIDRYDKVLVMEKGKVAAFDSPQKIKASGLRIQ